MNKRSLTFTTMALVLMLGLSGLAVAQPGQRQGQNGPGPQQPALTAEQQQAVAQIFDRHEDTLQSLGDQLWAKNVELQAVMNAPDVSRSEIRQLTDEIIALRAKMRAEREAIDQELADAGIERPGFGGGQGFGPGACGGPCFGGGRGGGRGMGPGGGYGCVF